HGDTDFLDSEHLKLWVAGDTHFYLSAFTNTQMLVDSKYALFGAYIKSAAIYKCPEYRSLPHPLTASALQGSLPAPRRPDLKIRSYSLNAFMGWAVDSAELSGSYTVFQKTSDLAQPANLFTFQDVHP